MLSGLDEGLEQQTNQQALAGWGRNEFGQRTVILDRTERTLPRRVNFRQVFYNPIRIGKSFGQRPLKRIVPKIRGEPATRLFHDCSAAEDILTNADCRRMSIQEFRWNRPHQIFQAFDQFSEFLLELLNDLAFGIFSHKSSRAPIGLFYHGSKAAAGETESVVHVSFRTDMGTA